MRKLTPEQQEVIDLIKEGWELAVDVSINGRCWLQKGGIGRGGETRVVKHPTVRALEYLDYIEKATSKFPAHTFRLKVPKPTTEMELVKSDPRFGEDYKHPSFGTISFINTSGGSHALFGSSIKHNNAIRLVISHAEKHRTNAQDYVFSRGVIVEAYMSATQFAEAISGFGSGREAPITLQFTEQDGSIDQPVLENKREQFELEFKERANGLVQRINSTIEKAKDKKVPKWVVDEMDLFKDWLKSNIPYLAEQFSEQMDQTVVEAKAEVESFLTSLVQRTGLEALADMAPQLTEGKPEGENNDEE